jgi:hypothetical protein
LFGGGGFDIMGVEGIEYSQNYFEGKPGELCIVEITLQDESFSYLEILKMANEYDSQINTLKEQANCK